MTQPALVEVNTSRTTCPVCEVSVSVWGSRGVIPHVLNEHPDSPDAVVILAAVASA